MYNRFPDNPKVNPFFRPFARPQTPLANMSGTSNLMNPLQPNRSFQKPSQSKLSHSRVSISSTQSHHPNQIFSQDLIYLLKNEQKSIHHFKEAVEKQKLKVENDFSVFKTEINHIVEDIKISVQAELDALYKCFIVTFAELKGSMQEMRLMRKEILMNNQVGYSNTGDNNQASNRDFIGEIEKDNENMRQFRIYDYLTQVQKHKLQPMDQLVARLITFSKTHHPLYRAKDMNLKLKEVKSGFTTLISEVYKQLPSYVESYESLQQISKVDNQHSKHLQREFQSGQVNRVPAFAEEDNKNMFKKSLIKQIASNEQAIVTKSCQEVDLSKYLTIITDHKESILCLYFIKNRFIATGSKDKTIQVYTLQGSKVATLVGHNASICCLSTVVGSNNEVLLGSGSDHGCSSLILWDTRSWTSDSRVQCHSAAVTAIVDLQDKRHLITGSYDKKIILYDFSKSQVVKTYNNNNTSVTGLVLSVDKGRLIVGGIDNSLSVWGVLRRNNTVQSISLERNVVCPSLVCQLQPCMLRNEWVMCATRDGNLRVVNVSTGEIVKSYTVNGASIIQLVLVERENKPDAPLALSCSAKDQALLLTRMDTGITTTLKTNQSLAIQFGCGIGPKIVFSVARDGLVAVLSQKNNQKEFVLYNVNFKSYFDV